MGCVVSSSPTFDLPLHSDINQLLAKHSGSQAAIWGMYAAAWNGVGYRFRAAIEHDRSFTLSAAKAGMPEADERYRQDHDLFAFHACAMSCVECFFFAAHCIAAMTKPSAFPMSTQNELRRIYPGDVHAKFLIHYSAEPVTTKMGAVLVDATYAALKDHRDALSHRGTPPRAYHHGGEFHNKTLIPENPKAASANWKYGVEIGPDTTRLSMCWLHAEMNELMACLRQFCEIHLR